MYLVSSGKVSLTSSSKADVPAVLTTNDGQASAVIGEAQDDSSPLLVLEQQAQSTEATEEVETDSLQNGGREDSEVAPAEDSHVTSVSKSPSVEQPFNDLSCPSTRSSDTSSTKSITSEPSVEEFFKCLSKGPKSLLRRNNT
ncbi:hypothetical protein ACEPAG_2397 [Sanghuangporus baumii]